MKELVKSPVSGKGRAVWIGLIWGVVAVLWASSFALVVWTVRSGIPQVLPDVSSLVTLIFAACSFAMILFSLLIGAVAFMGWQTLEREVKKDIEASTKARLELLEKEVQGRANATIGFTLGELHSTPDQLDQEKHKDYLSEAVVYCNQGYQILKDIPGNAKYMALNNLIYYSCLYGVGIERRDYFLQQAKVLKSIGQEFDTVQLLLTYCRVILQYGSSHEDTRDALSIAAGLLSRTGLTERQKKEAAFYATSLGKQMESSRKS